MKKLTVREAIGRINDFMSGLGDCKGYDWLYDDCDTSVGDFPAINMADKRLIIKSAIEGFRELAKVEINSANYLDKQEMLDSIMLIGEVAEALEFLRDKYGIEP